MARGKQQYVRLAKPMGYVDLENNEFDNFLSKKMRGKFKSSFFSRITGCKKKASTMRFANEKGKKDFMKKCIGERKEEMRTKSNLGRIIAGKGKKTELDPPNIGGSFILGSVGRRDSKYKIKEKERPFDPVDEKPIDVDVSKPTEILTTTKNGNGVAVPPATHITPEPITKTAQKGVLYLAIGIVILVFGLKIIK